MSQKCIDSINGRDYLDCGAYIGDSAIILKEHFKAKRIFCFEPNSMNYNNLLESIHLNKLEQFLFPIKKGVGVENTYLKMINNGVISKVSTTPDQNYLEEVEIVKIDEFVKFNDLNIGLIKMDIEGFELEAVKGALSTIKKFKPTLLISIYHTGKDFFEIPTLLKLLVPEYKFRFANLNRKKPIQERILICSPLL
ncbi:FkbM family methyltransferase [Methanosalsum natronophilum]|uniref:FkbM family methyltransferase n=1 Tax=Methanosalsum natronophilum TaxID=768733 RepID=UPI00216A9673|nr:FkbM family methyltransferase [Methanosalsum natronophilum]MCS3924928.1 FkbM family methyltransferase [Methanosalsum natronophilum]